MSNRKGIKTTKGRATKTTSATQHGDLAELLSAVMRHPNIPADLHTYIGDWLVSGQDERIDSPDYIRRSLDSARRKGGGR